MTANAGKSGRLCGVCREGWLARVSNKALAVRREKGLRGHSGRFWGREELARGTAESN